MKINRGLALADLLACGAILVLVSAIGLPTLERARELSKRMACSINLKGIGLATTAYAEGNNGDWMVPPFKNGAINNGGIAYLCEGNNSFDYACVGYERERQSTSETNLNPAGGSTALSTTRAYWMLVRSSGLSVKQFICPNSLHDFPDPTELIDLYYDFSEYQNISYGYLVPFGPPETRPRAGRDPRVVFAADKGPFYLNVHLEAVTGGPNGQPLELNHSPRSWNKFNSPNHGEYRESDGQNALYVDGRVEFLRRSTAGVDSDNIYTVMWNEWGPYPYNRSHGASPHEAPVPNPFPGQEALGPGINDYSTTDSLIYP